ncbi:HAD hydrolase-like protein [Paenibacillus dendritiformis]|uniref:HAD hydrolase-like protein n=1 Tax=Paenibacillus dendritiformis TaxID=130049 RepID=UPI001F24647E|nr:HAD hydrolase-like protein [Paenibacillus dendritiformis]
MAFINEVLRKYKFFEYFDRMISGEEVAKGKPAPDIYLEVSKQLNVSQMNVGCLKILKMVFKQQNGRNEMYWFY